MTQAELDALPEMGGITYEDVPGSNLSAKRPVLGKRYALAEAVAVLDSRGERWMVGEALGRRWRQRML